MAGVRATLSVYQHVGSHRSYWTVSQLPVVTFLLVTASRSSTYFALLLGPACVCVSALVPLDCSEHNSLFQHGPPATYACRHISARPHRLAFEGRVCEGCQFRSTKAYDLQGLARSALYRSPLQSPSGDSCWIQRDGVPMRARRIPPLPAEIHLPFRVFADSLDSNYAVCPSIWIPERSLDLRCCGEETLQPVKQPPVRRLFTDSLSPRIPPVQVIGWQPQLQCKAGKCAGWMSQFALLQQQRPTWPAGFSQRHALQQTCCPSCSPLYAWLPSYSGGAYSHSSVRPKDWQQASGRSVSCVMKIVGSSGTASPYASKHCPPQREGDRASVDVEKLERKNCKSLSFAEFKRANMWVEELISEHLLTTQRRGPLNEPPRPGPSSQWEMLAEGRVLKRQVAGGEGDAFPTIRSNVTIEFALHSLGGAKLTDNRAFNTTMMEFPLANAAPGLQTALTSMRKLERSVFLVAPELVLPADFEVSLAVDHMKNVQPAPRKSAVHRGGAMVMGHPSSSDSPLAIRLTGGEWLAFDVTMCNMYDKDSRWWRLGPDVQFVKDLPEECIPSNTTQDEWLERKADALREKIEGEMLTNPNSHYWEDIEPAMTSAQRENIEKCTSRLYGLDTPADPRRDGSRGFRNYILDRSGGIRHGYEMGDRMAGASKHYVWRETLFSFEIVLFIKEGIRSEHVTWDINSKRIDIYFGGNKVFGDAFLHTIAYKDGAAWTLTEAACHFPPMDLRKLQALYEAVPLSTPNPPSSTTGTQERRTQLPESLLDKNLKEPSAYAHPGLLGLAPDEMEDAKLPLNHPALHIILQKGRNWTQLWGCPFKFI